MTGLLIRLAATCVASALTVSCRDDAKIDPTVGRDGRDHAKLEAIVQADESFDRAMKAADDAERAGDDARAAEILQGQAKKAADDAVDKAAATELETPWAGGRRDSLVAVLRARRDTIAPYAVALKGDDLDAKLAAVTTQLELQKWAIDAARAALAPPDATADAH